MFWSSKMNAALILCVIFHPSPFFLPPRFFFSSPPTAVPSVVSPAAAPAAAPDGALDATVPDAVAWLTGQGSKPYSRALMASVLFA